ncbi:MAG: PhzF family phenazine biosynthesis protein [Anaerovoracaceae bacterium]|nr:PhzF family phenazine biosynthesis protein [Anaerovoracaceae bacterium]
MKLKQYVVDAFTDKVFHGNPAAVCVVDDFLPEDTIMDITRENNLSETAFVVKTGDARYDLRWFTPGGEIDLCGHATLGTSFVLMNFYEPDMKEVTYSTKKSGELIVRRDGDLYEMDFPAYKIREIPVTDQMEDACGSRPLRAFIARDLVCVLDDEDKVRNFEPDQSKIIKLEGSALQITARGSGEYDCVSRSFVPKLNVPEDPVNGSGHCHIVPFWTKELGKNDIAAYQASPRGGTLYCTQEGDRIKLRGKAVKYSEAEIEF